MKKDERLAIFVQYIAKLAARRDFQKLECEIFSNDVVGRACSQKESEEMPKNSTEKEKIPAKSLNSAYLRSIIAR